MASSTIRIVQGSDVAITIDLTDKNTKQPFSLTGFTGATAFFGAATGGALTTPGTLKSADLGQIVFNLDEIQTAGLATGDELDFEVHVDQGANRTIAQILGKLAVVAQLFS